MSYSFTAASSQYLSASEAPLGSAPDRPWMVTAWARPTSIPLGASQHIALIGQSAANQYEGLSAFSDDFYAQSRDGSTNAPANTSGAGLASATWAHGAARFDSATSRSAYVGTSQGTVVTTSVSPTGFDRVTVGCRPTITEYFDGLIAHVAFWTLDGMDETAIDNLVSALAGGGNPLGVTTDAVLLRYWPLVDNGDLADQSGNGGATLTATGATHSSTNPTVDDPPSGGGSSYLNLTLMGVG